MIELLFADRCKPCGACVNVCPNDVFDRDEAGRPVIARQSDCVTCFICEAFCPEDALYVAPFARPEPDLDAATVLASGEVGAYRKALGWDRYRPGQPGVEPPTGIPPTPPRAGTWGVAR